MATQASPRPQADPPARRPTGARRELLLLAALFLGAALISGFTMLRGIDPFDEGLMLQAARRISDGQIPYRDFLWAYGPGQPYLLSGLHDITGVSLLDWRVVRVLADAGVALFAFLLARRLAGPRAGVVAWLAVAAVMAQPRSANPFPLALLFVLAAMWSVSAPAPSRRPVLAAAALIALAAVWRLDFAIFGGAAVAVMLVLEPGSRGERGRRAGLFAVAAAALGLLAYMPFLIAIGPADLYDALVGASLREASYWTLPFPFGYHGSLRAWPPGALASDLKDVVDNYVPLLLVAGLGGALAAAAVRVRRDRSLPPLWAGLLVLAAGLFLYMRSRADEFHTAPLLVALAVLLPAVIAWLLRERPLPRGRAVAAGLAAAVLALLLAHGVLNRLSALFGPEPHERLDLPVADGVKAPPAEAAALPRVVRLVQQRVAPGEPMYVVSLRSDLVRFNNPLLYVLAERENPTDRDFGLQTGAAAQARIVAALERARPKAIVRWTDPISVKREPNRRGRPSGVRTLDAWLAANYTLLERAGRYDVLVPRRG